VTERGSISQHQEMLCANQIWHTIHQQRARRKSLKSWSPRTGDYQTHNDTINYSVPHSYVVGRCDSVRQSFNETKNLNNVDDSSRLSRELDFQDAKNANTESNHIHAFDSIRVHHECDLIMMGESAFQDKNP
jgi:hypothetical protein